MVIVRFILGLIYWWMWWIPTKLTLLAITFHLVVINIIWGTIDVLEIKENFEDSRLNYLLFFILPFGFTMFLAFISALSQGALNNETSLNRAIRFRNAQMKNKTPKEAFNILISTSKLDVLKNADGEGYEKARRGFEAEQGNSSAAKVYRDFIGL